MKLECAHKEHSVNAMRGDYCDWCGQFICNDCWHEHKSECYNTDIDIDDFGNCYSDADPGL